MREGIDRAFALIRDMVRDSDKYPENVIFIAPDHVASVFSAERARIYSVVKERGTVESVNELAEMLGRDATRVSRDLATLEGYGLIHLERVPGAKTKHIHADPRPIMIA